VVVLLAGLTYWVIRRDGNLAWDDSDYLRRGLHNVGAARAQGGFDLARLVGATLKDRPRPPLLIAWVEVGVLLFGKRHMLPLVVYSSVVPFGLLLLAVAAISRRLFGASASLLAILLLASSPMTLALGAKVMVETFMALWILAIFLAAAQHLERPTRLRALMLGTTLACALLTKLTVALLLPMPAAVYVYLYLRRYPLDRSALRNLLWIVLPILALAGPWYVVNGRSAVGFALYSSRYDVLALGKADATPRLERLRILADRLVGTPSLLLVPLAGWGFIRARRSLDPAERFFVLLALLAAISGALILLYPSYFDARFLLPICPALAIVLGWGLYSVGGLARPGFLVVVGAVLCAGVFQSASQLAHQGRTATYWPAARLIDDLVERHGVAVLANVGDCADWNVSKTGLINELRARPRECFVLHDLSRNTAPELARRLKRLDAVVMLRREYLSSEFLASSPGLNRAYGAVEPLLRNDRRFERIEPRVAGLPPLEVFVRRK
jgi:4-amino-4-deoxy-L-arabinose transferase-like glycosyltransferase